MRHLVLRSYFFMLLALLSKEQLLTFAGKTDAKIVIVGAGAAGIAAATRLVDDGFTDVTILEVKPRIGGRIHTVPFAENVVDIGAEYVCGEKDNVVYELGAKHDALDKSGDEWADYSGITSAAQLIPMPVLNRLRKIASEVETERVKEIGNFTGTVGEYTKMKFDEKLAKPENADIDKETARLYYITYDKEASSDEGTDTLNEISARDYANFEELEGDAWMIWKDKGYIEYLQLLMDTHSTGKGFGKLNGKVHLSKPVEHIQWQRDNKKALVKTKTGEEYQADHVIVTVPLGVLKLKSKQLFEPELPTEKEIAIKALGFKSGNKIFVELKEPFWHETWNGAYFLWRDEDLKDIRGTKRSWLEGIFGVFTVAYQPNVLAALIVGEGARQMEKLTEDEVKDGMLYLLDKFIPPEKKEIVNIVYSTWNTDPDFLGGYSYHSLETEKANVDNKQLAAPIKLGDDKPILLFAGEATSSKHYTTVHGAVETGLREAERIKDYYK